MERENLKEQNYKEFRVKMQCLEMVSKNAEILEIQRNIEGYDRKILYNESWIVKNCRSTSSEKMHIWK